MYGFSQWEMTLQHVTSLIGWAHIQNTMNSGYVDASVYPMKYKHGFVVLCFIVVMLEVPDGFIFTHNLQGWQLTLQNLPVLTGLILGLRPANERQRYFVMMSLIDWAEALCLVHNWRNHRKSSETHGGPIKLLYMITCMFEFLKNWLNDKIAF